MRLIDADALMERLKEYCIDGDEQVMQWYDIMGIDEAIDNAPTIDAVPVVRCKDCKHWDKDTLRHNSNDVAEWDECECKMLANRDGWNEIDRYCCDIHFCADGERREKGDE